MPSGKQKRKRVVASCTQCYAKKQKCNHQYPCNHCTRRRLPELCSYNSIDTDVDKDEAKGNLPSGIAPVTSAKRRLSTNAKSQSQADGGEDTFDSPSIAVSPSKAVPSSENLSSCLGYLEGSKSNMLGLMEKFNLLSYGELAGGGDSVVPPNSMPEVEACLQLMPRRVIIDRLIKHFLEELNWISEMIHPTSFLTRYEQWWRSFPGSTVEDLDFCALVLTVCAYSAQYLPSRSLAGPKIHGMLNDTIREHCFDLSKRMSSLCASFPGNRSLARVQHLYYAACYQKNEGRVKDAYYVLGDAIRLAHDLEMHMEYSLSSRVQLNELDKDLRRRAFWNLYIWDRFLSVVLDRLPFISDDICSVELPKMRLVPDIGDDHAPEVFTERILQIRLMKFFYSMTESMKARQVPYDPVSAEEQYEILYRKFVSTLPPAFVINNPELKWDDKLPKLPRQRVMLRISIFIVLCQLFRPLLRLTTEQLESLPSYKRELVSKHRSRLVDAAISVLDNIYCLHDSMGGKESRYFLLGFYIFEPAMILAMHLLSLESKHKALGDAMVERESFGKSVWFQESTSCSSCPALNVAQCRSHIRKALERLQTLGEGNQIARLGACKLSEVIAKLEALARPTENDDSVATSGFMGSAQSSRMLNNPDTNENSWFVSEMVTERDASISSAYPTPVHSDYAVLGWMKDFSMSVSGHSAPQGDQWSPYYVGASGPSITVNASPFYRLSANSDIGRTQNASTRTGAEAEVEIQTSRPHSTASVVYRQSLPNGPGYLQNAAQFKSDWQLPTETMDRLPQSRFL